MPAEVLTFQLDDDYGWDDGLICGGRMSILVDPLASGMRAALHRILRMHLHRLAAEGCGATEAIVFDADASGVPRRQPLPVRSPTAS